MKCINCFEQCHFSFYRRDLDPFVETTEENDRKIAEMRDSKDKYACTIEGDK